MRKLKIAAIAFLSLLILFLCAALGVSLATGGAGIGLGFGSGSVIINSDYSLVLEKEIPAEDIRSLKIDYTMTSNDVFFYSWEGDNIIIREYMNYTPKENKLTTVNKNGSELIIKGAKRTFLFFFSIRAGDAYTEIYLPDGFSESLDQLQVKTSSGKQDSETAFSVKNKFEFSSVSGDIHFPGISSSTAEGSTVSGCILIDSAAAKRINFSVISGDVTLEQSEGDLSISSTSGNIRLNQQQGSLDVSTVSGDITLNQVAGDMNLSTASGNIRLQEGIGFLETDSISGDARIDSLDGDFSMSTTSGELVINKGKGCGNAETVSGDVRLFLEALEGDVYVSTTSGNVSLKLPKTSAFTLDYGSTSGRCRTFFDEAVDYGKNQHNAQGSYGGGTHEVTVSTISGDLDIIN